MYSTLITFMIICAGFLYSLMMTPMTSPRTRDTVTEMPAMRICCKMSSAKNELRSAYSLNISCIIPFSLPSNLIYYTLTDYFWQPEAVSFYSECCICFLLKSNNAGRKKVLRPTLPGILPQGLIFLTIPPPSVQTVWHGILRIRKVWKFPHS